MTGWLVILAAVFAAAIFLLLRSEYERKHLAVQDYTIYSHKIRAGERVFVFLSDLHSNTFGADNGELLAAIDRVGPEAVLIGGDMMVCRGDVDLTVTEALLKKLSAAYPVYYGKGNHEQRLEETGRYREKYKEFQRILADTGVHYLSDATETFREDIAITGCNLEEQYYKHHFTVPGLQAGLVERHVGKSDPGRFNLLLLHSPLFFDSAAGWGADLTLSGHFHGGTIRLPFLGGVMTPQYQFFLPWCRGKFEKDGKTMIVSGGLGTHSVNIRLNNRPQLIVIRLRPGKELL